MLDRYLLDNWRLFFDTDQPSCISVVPLSSCSEDFGNDLVLIFLAGNKTPQYVLKIARNTKYGFKLRREYAALTMLAADQRIADFTPKPYYLGNRDGIPFFLQGGVPGISLIKILKEKGFADKNSIKMLNQAVDLLTIVNRVDAFDRTVTGELCKASNVLANKDLHNKIFKANIPNKQIDEMNNYCEKMEQQNASYFVHGDYWPANIILNSSATKIQGIIDWEFCSPKATLPFDIIWFLLTMTAGMHKNTVDSGSSILEAFKWGFYCEGPHNMLISSLYQRYISRFDYDFGSFSSLLKCVLAVMSVRELNAYGRSFKMDNLHLGLLRYAVQQDTCIYD